MGTECPDVIGMGMLSLEEQGWHMDGDARMCLCRTRMVTWRHSLVVGQGYKPFLLPWVAPLGLGTEKRLD